MAVKVAWLVFVVAVLAGCAVPAADSPLQRLQRVYAGYGIGSEVVVPGRAVDVAGLKSELAGFSEIAMRCAGGRCFGSAEEAAVAAEVGAMTELLESQEALNQARELSLTMSVRRPDCSSGGRVERLLAALETAETNAELGLQKRRQWVQQFPNEAARLGLGETRDAEAFAELLKANGASAREQLRLRCQ